MQLASYNNCGGQYLIVMFSMHAKSMAVSLSDEVDQFTRGLLFGWGMGKLFAGLVTSFLVFFAKSMT